MSEWLNYVKAYAEKNKITYKQALRDASPSYKTRNEKKPEESAATSGRLVGGSTSNEPKIEAKIETPLEKEKPKRKSNKKVVENITLKF
jgi:hypothetical protein